MHSSLIVQLGPRRTPLGLEPSNTLHQSVRLRKGVGIGNGCASLVVGTMHVANTIGIEQGLGKLSACGMSREKKKRTPRASPPSLTRSGSKIDHGLDFLETIAVTFHRPSNSFTPWKGVSRIEARSTGAVAYGEKILPYYISSP